MVVGDPCERVFLQQRGHDPESELLVWKKIMVMKNVGGNSKKARKEGRKVKRKGKRKERAKKVRKDGFINWWKINTSFFFSFSFSYWDSISCLSQPRLTPNTCFHPVLQPLKCWQWQVHIPKPGSQHFTFNLTVFPYLRIWMLSNKLERIWCSSVCEATNCVWACRSVHTGMTNCVWACQSMHTGRTDCVWACRSMYTRRTELGLGSYSLRVIVVYYCYTMCFRKEERKRGRNDFVRKLSYRHPETGVFGVESCVSSFGFWMAEFLMILRGNSQGGRRNRERRKTDWCSESPQQRWQRASQGKEGGAENNVRKSPGRGAGGMENVEAPTVREIDCFHIQEWPAELALAGKGKFTFWTKIPFFFLNPSVAHQGAPFQPLWKKGHPGVVGLLFAF